MKWRLGLLAAMLAIVGQIGLLSASLTLAHDESSAVSHTEQSGVDLHHGHNEATCAACIALSFQATIKSAPPVPSIELLLVAHRQSAVELVTGVQVLLNSSRAPPREG